MSLYTEPAPVTVTAYWSAPTEVESLGHWYCSCPYELASHGKFHSDDHTVCAVCGDTKAEYEDFYRANQDRHGWHPRLL